MGDISVIHPAEAASSDTAYGAVVRGVLIGGVLAGVVDIFAAVLINQAPPGLILRFIASGLVGKMAFQGAGPMMALGFGLQLAMAVLIAATYGAASLRLPALTRHPVSLGALFGVGVFIVMSFIVVPLSAAVHPKHPPSLAAIGQNLAAMVLFGLIVSLSQAWASRAKA